MLTLGRHIPVHVAQRPATVERGAKTDITEAKAGGDSVELSASTAISLPGNKLATDVIVGAVPGPVGACLALLSHELDPNDIHAWDKAENYYERVRDCSEDVEAIAANTPYSERQVGTIKNHLFYNTHILDEGVARFDADPLIANAWSRLQQGRHSPQDLQLMEHELFEARFEALYDTDYRTAHAAADRSGRPSGLYA